MAVFARGRTRLPDDFCSVSDGSGAGVLGGSALILDGRDLRVGASGLLSEVAETTD